MKYASAISVLVAVVVAAVVLGTRLLGPADLYEKDQPKTIAYTADAVLNGRYALPRDVLYQPATKPPLYNWIGAAVVKVSGSWDEWALKAPSLIAAIGTGLLVFAVARRLHPQRSIGFASLAAAIWFTFGSDVRHASVMRLSYLARPDMLQCFLLTAAWVCATWMLRPDPARATPESDPQTPADRPSRARALLWPTLFWLCVSGAALAKGPMAAVAIVYAVVFSLLTTRRFAWMLGVIIPVVLVGGWMAMAYQQDPQHVRQTILGAEIVERVTDESPEGFSKPVYFSVMWFVTKALPWGAVAMVGLVLYCIRRTENQTFLPAVVWLAVILLTLSIPAGKRMDYLLPAYAPGAIVAALAVATLLGRYARWAMFAPLGVAVVLAYVYQARFHESVNHWSDRAVAFAEQVRPVIGEARTVVIVRGKHPIPTLLGRHHGSYLTPADLEQAEWVILPLQPGVAPVVASEPVPVGFETLETRKLAPLGLYRRGDLPLDLLVRQQQDVARWTREENPYRAPDTVFRVE